MEQTSQREIHLADPTWSLGELMANFTQALAGTGPALTFSPVDCDRVGNRTALVITTTGSSGVPKQVELSATALISSARASNKFLDAKPGDRWSLLLPLNHVAGINVLIRALDLGTDVVDLRNAAGEYPRADFTAVVPTQIHKALHSDPKLLAHLQGAKAVLVGGAALTEKLHKEAQSVGINIVTTYGMTETSGGCFYNNIPLDGVNYSLSPEGQISISGPVLAHGFLNQEDLWDSLFADGWFKTSDAGEVRDGKLFVNGRIDDVIISGGSNISLNQIDEILAKEFPGISCASFARPDERWGQALHIAYVGDADLEYLSTRLVEVLGERAKPKGFVKLTVLPLIGIGKIDRAALSKMEM